MSYFVEVFINTLKLNGASVIAEPLASRLAFDRLACVNLQPDIARYRHHLLPFEFARRGIHMTLKQGDFSSLEADNLQVWDLSTLRFGRKADDDENFADEGFRLPVPQSHASKHPGTIIHAFKCELEEGDNFFTYKSCRYNLAILDGYEGGRGIVKLHCVGEGSSFAGGGAIEELILLTSSLDLGEVETLDKRGVLYAREEHDISYITEDGGAFNKRESKDMPLIHGMMTRFYNCQVLGHSPAVLIVAAKEHPLLVFEQEAFEESSAELADVWKITIDESPEWALCTEGAAP